MGGDLHGWWKLRALPTKTGGNTPSKKTRPPNAASSVLVHDEVGLERLSVRHVLVCLIDFIQRIAVREDLARIDLTVKERLQQDFLGIGRHRSRTDGKRDVSVERFCRIHLGAMRQADAADKAAGTNDAECLVGRALSADAFKDGIGTVAAHQFEDLFDAFRSAFSHDISCARFKRHLLAVFVTAHDDDLRSSEHLGGDHRTLTDDDDLVAWFDVCGFSGVVAGCHDIGKRFAR